MLFLVIQTLFLSTCVIDFLSESTTLTILTALMAFYIPAAIMSLLYFRVYTGIFSRRKNLEHEGRNSIEESDDETFTKRMSRRYSSMILSLKKGEFKPAMAHRFSEFRGSISSIRERMNSNGSRNRRATKGENSTSDEGRTKTVIDKPRKLSNLQTDSSQMTSTDQNSHSLLENLTSLKCWFFNLL